MKRFALPVFLGLLSFLGGLGGVLLVSHEGPRAFAEPSNSSYAVNDINRLGERFEWIARKLSPSVVAVEAIKPPAAGKTKNVEESGSGVLVRISGQRGIYVLTNNHVISGAEPRKITVSLADNRLLKPSQVWADPESDIAVMRLEAEGLSPADMGDSDRVHVGQWVLAYGSPFGLNQTVTHGIISARERGQISLGNTIRIKDFLQTDAAINPGSSGGPLLNLDGEVIGINTAIASNSGSNSGVAFSIPINLVKRIAIQLIEKGSVARGYIGCQVAPSFEVSDAERLGLDRAQGALIEKVYANTPAAAAGLQPRDVILQIDTTSIRNENHFINVVSSMKAGSRVRLQVWRDRRTMMIDVEIGDWSRGQGQLKP